MDTESISSVVSSLTPDKCALLFIILGVLLILAWGGFLKPSGEISIPQIPEFQITLPELTPILKRVFAFLGVLLIAVGIYCWYVFEIKSMIIFSSGQFVATLNQATELDKNPVYVGNSGEVKATEKKRRNYKKYF